MRYSYTSATEDLVRLTRCGTSSIEMIFLQSDKYFLSVVFFLSVIFFLSVRSSVALGVRRKSRYFFIRVCVHTRTTLRNFTGIPRCAFSRQPPKRYDRTGHEHSQSPESVRSHASHPRLVINFVSESRRVRVLTQATRDSSITASEIR